MREFLHYFANGVVHGLDVGGGGDDLFVVTADGRGGGGEGGIVVGVRGVAQLFGLGGDDCEGGEGEQEDGEESCRAWNGVWLHFSDLSPMSCCEVFVIVACLID